MAEAGETVAIFETGDGVLLFGSEASLAPFDADPDVVSKSISKSHMARVAGHAGTAGGKLAAESGRWVKLTSASAKDVKAAGGISKVAAGVLRGDTGQITKHLKFENLTKGALLTPAAPAVLGAMATQFALEAALDDITAYLESIDLKLDQLLKQRKTETLGELGGVTLAIDEAAAIYAHTGTVSEVTWSKIDGLSFVLQKMQWEAVEQIDVVAHDVQDASGATDRLAKALGKASEDTQFWLGILARAIALQDRYYILELARLEEEDVLQLDAHRQGIGVARSERVRRITAGLTAVGNSVAQAAELSNAAKVSNPIAAPRIMRRSNGLRTEMSSFADHAHLQLGELAVVEETSWARAARGMVGDASTAAVAVRDGVAGRAKSVGHAVEDRRDERILRKAKKIEKKRSGGE